MKIPLIFTLLLSATSLFASQWIQYSECTLSENGYFDGDSFNRVLGLKQNASRPSRINWRLYGVDCPETDLREPTRIKEQAKAFKISESKVIFWGKRASEFSKNFLSKPFTVFTKFDKAGGASARNRYFAIIKSNDGRLLHEALLENGLARAYGKNVAWPPGSSERAFAERLQSLERSARERKVGIWSTQTR